MTERQKHPRIFWLGYLGLALILAPVVISQFDGTVDATTTTEMVISATGGLVLAAAFIQLIRVSNRELET